MGDRMTILSERSNDIVLDIEFYAFTCTELWVKNANTKCVSISVLNSVIIIALCPKCAGAGRETQSNTSQ